MDAAPDTIQRRRKERRMTREEAIKWLKLLHASPLIYGEHLEAIDMAIEALEAEQKNESDLISRRAAIDEINKLSKWNFETFHETRLSVVSVIDVLMEMEGENE